MGKGEGAGFRRAEESTTLTVKSCERMSFFLI
jgi:hypothetical protein